MPNLTPIVRVGSHTLQVAGGELQIFSRDNTVIMYDGELYNTNDDMGIGGSHSNPKIIIRHKIDDSSLKIYNKSECNIRIVGQNTNIPPRTETGFDVSLDDVEYISIENTSTNQSIKIGVQFDDSDTEEVADNEGLADTLLENPYTDKEVSSELSLSSILENSNDAELIGRGSYRLAFRVNPADIDALRESDGGIVKVAMTPTGTEVNKQEMQTWQAVKGKIESRLFCPVTSIGSNHKYIIMREAHNINTFDENVVKRIEDRVISSVLFDSDDSEIPSPCAKFDIKSRNIGTYGGTAVLIDYPYGGKFTLASDKVDEFQEQLEANL